MTRLKKENSEYFYIQSKNKCDLKWSLNLITIGKSSELYIAIFFLSKINMKRLF